MISFHALAFTSFLFVRSCVLQAGITKPNVWLFHQSPSTEAAVTSDRHPPVHSGIGHLSIPTAPALLDTTGALSVTKTKPELGPELLCGKSPSKSAHKPLLRNLASSSNLFCLPSLETLLKSCPTAAVGSGSPGLEFSKAQGEGTGLAWGDGEVSAGLNGDVHVSSPACDTCRRSSQREGIRSAVPEPPLPPF